MPEALVEPAMMQAAGPPGNVDKGPKQARGVVLRLQAPASTTRFALTTRLQPRI